MQDDETQNPGAEAADEDAGDGKYHIEMPSEPARRSAAAKAAADAARADWQTLEKDLKDAWDARDSAKAAADRARADAGIDEGADLAAARDAAHAVAKALEANAEILRVAAEHAAPADAAAAKAAHAEAARTLAAAREAADAADAAVGAEAASVAADQAARVADMAVREAYAKYQAADAAADQILRMEDLTDPSDQRYDNELEDKGIDTKDYEELAEYYQSLYKVVQANNWRDGDQNPTSRDVQKTIYTYEENLKDLETPEELEAAIKDLMRIRDSQNARFQELEARYAKELAAEDDYGRLAEYYKDLYIVLNPDEFPNEGDVERFRQTNLESFENVDTLEELKREYAALLEWQDARLRYAKELEEDKIDTPEKLAEHYKHLWKLVYKDEFVGDPKVDTPQERAELREATMRLMKEHDNMPSPVRIEVEEVEPEPGADAGGGEIKQSYDSADAAADATRSMQGVTDAAAADAAALDAAGLDVADDAAEDALRAADDVTKAAAREAADEDAGDVEPESARRPTGADAAPTEEDASRLIGGEALPSEDLRDEAFFSGEEGEGVPDAVAAAAPAAAEGVEIEMPPDYVGRAGADAAAQEPNNAPDLVAASPEELGQDAPAADPWAGTPPPGTTEPADAEVAAQEPNNAPDPWGDAAKPGGSEGLGQEQPSGEGSTAAPTEQGGSPFWGVDETGPPTGDVPDYEQATAEGVEIEMPPDPDEIEMPPDYVGQAGADAGGVEIEVPPDPAETETPPEDHFEDVL